MRMLFVNLPSAPDNYVRGDKMLPYSLLYVANYAGKFGYKVPILDLASSPDWVRDWCDYLGEHRIDLVGFTTSTESRFLVWDAIRMVKWVNPSAVVVVGGNHFTYTADQTLGSIPEVDYVVRGEGEATFLELADYLTKGVGGLQDIMGLSYRRGDRIVHNPQGKVEQDIDKFNVTDDVDVILPRGRYSPFVNLRNWWGIKALPIVIGRGCPNRCVFCLNPKRVYRYRSIGSIVEEIKDKQKRYMCDAFYLEDPHLVKKADFVRELCEAIIKENLGIVWYAETRMDIDPDLLGVMRKAGCISLDFGLESGSPKVLRAIKKDIDLERAKELLLKCESLGIKTGVFAMVSLPDEEEEDARMTIGFLRKNIGRMTNIIYTITKIFPGAELESIAMERGCLPEGFNWYDRSFNNNFGDFVPFTVPIYREHLSPSFIRRCWNEVAELKASNTGIAQIVGDYLKGLPGFMFDWKSQGVRDKVGKLHSVYKTIGGRLTK